MFSLCLVGSLVSAYFELIGKIVIVRVRLEMFSLILVESPVCFQFGTS